MNEYEKLQRETIKNLMKMVVINNQKLDSCQKQMAIKRIDEAATKADWLMEVLTQCGYIRKND